MSPPPRGDRDVVPVTAEGLAGLNLTSPWILDVDLDVFSRGRKRYGYGHSSSLSSPSPLEEGRG